jgi:hypothetical protein
VERARRELEAYAEARVPQRVRDQVRLEATARGKTLTLWELRVPWSGSPSREWTRAGVARFRFDRFSRSWVLYYRDSHGRFHRYELVPQSREFSKLLQEVQADPTGIFWG